MSFSIPQADFTPQLVGYTGQGAFRFWCQKVLPIVYDDSLSYYELLNKVVVYLNNVISDVSQVETNVGLLNDSFNGLQNHVNTSFDAVETEINSFEDGVNTTVADFIGRVNNDIENLETFLDNYFDNLDVQQEINHKLDEMAQDGSLTALVLPLVEQSAPSVITQWLEDNITPTTPAVDSSLSVSGAAADAKVTGDAITKITDGIEQAGGLTIDYTGYRHSGYLNGNTLAWTSITSTFYKYAVVPVKPLSSIKVVSSGTAGAGIACLKSYTEPTSSGDLADLSTGSGWTTLIVVGTSTTAATFEGVLPSDASYLYINMTDTRRPQHVIIDGYDYAISIPDNVSNYASDLSNTDNELNKVREGLEQTEVMNVDYANYRHSGYLNGTTLAWTSVNSTFFKYCIIPVQPNSTLEVISNGTMASGVAILKNYTEPTEGELAELSESTGWDSLIVVGTSSSVGRFYGIVPNDGAFLYINLTDNRRPSKIIINGYDYAGSIHGNLIGLLSEYNVYPVLTDFADKDSTAAHGITYSISNNVITLEGTATGTNLNLNLSGSTTSLPFWFVAGKNYYIDIDTTKNSGSTLPVITISLYKNGVFDSNLFYSTASDYVQIPDNINEYSGAIFRIFVKRNNYVDCSVKLGILTGATPNALFYKKPQINPVKIRVMQNNVGHFNKGQPLNGPAQYLTTENVNAVLNAYRNMYGAVQPDIIGLEEFEDSRDVYNEGSVSQTVSFDNAIYDRLYPQKFKYTGLTSAPAIKSKYKINSATTVSIEYTYDYNNTQPTALLRAVYAQIDICGRVVGVFVSAFPSGAGDENIAKRIGAFNAAIDYLVDDEYAIIICDANNSGIASSTDIENSITEGNSLYNNVLKPHGYNSAMGSYFSWQQSWESTNTHYVSSVDNIYYKDNGKIMLSGLKVLSDLYGELLSDHYPIYADLMLM